MSARHTDLPLVSSLHHAAASLVRIARHLPQRLALARSRQRLSRLDDHLLRDIGLTRDEARAEAERRSWDAPSHWLG